MNKLKEIFKSWNIALDPNETQAELASQRIEICNSCEFKVENLGFNQCSVCGCALKAKVFSPVKGACPEGKWNIIDNVMINQRIPVENDKNLEIFTIENFLTDEECDHLCSLIEKNHARSTVSGTGYIQSIVSDFRTSSTSTLDTGDPIVDNIDTRIANELGVLKENGESFQGQLYEVGQQFKHHHDYFSGDSYNNHCLYSGQRTYTCMIYLNHVEEGGETDFPQINTTFSPKKGMAVIWKNSNGTGSENPASIHAGLPVIKGKKMIVTKWYRERKWDMSEDTRLKEQFERQMAQAQAKLQPVINGKTFRTKDDLPRLSPLGFKVVKVPTNTWRLIQEAYKLLENVKTVEHWEGITDFIHDKDGNAPVEIFNMDHCHRIKEIIAEELKPIHEEFIDNKEKLIPKWIYGIRSYKNGAILENHTDTLQTHHISSIIIVDKKVNKDWALDIQDHEGNWHKVYTEPGDMILYESATNLHGRIEPFDGEYYRNFFLHYTLADYKYQQ
jgi:prolyl 4-hydroxylase